MQRSTFLRQLGGAISAMGGTSASRAASGVRIGRVSYKGWSDAYRLWNGIVEVVVVPSVARVMRYGLVGGPNMLWENPAVAGKPIPLHTWPGGGGTGGDKVWPWPQDDWGRLTGSAWPPPAGADQAHHQIEIIGIDTLRMTSPPVIPLGLRIVRDIKLHANGSEVTFTNRFIKYRDGGTPFPIAVWTITQTPVGDGRVWIQDGRSGEATGRYRQLDGKPFASVMPTGAEGGALSIQRDPALTSKIGTEGYLLASRAGNTLFTIRQVDSNEPVNGSEYQTMERAQVYAQPDNEKDRQKGISPYFELELTAPRKMLVKAGDMQTMNIRWTLERLSGDSDDDVTRWLSGSHEAAPQN